MNNCSTNYNLYNSKNIYTSLYEMGEKDFCENIIKENIEDIFKNLERNRKERVSSELILFFSERTLLSKEKINKLLEYYDKNYEYKLRKNISLSIYYSCENIREKDKDKLVDIILEEDNKELYYDLIISFWAADFNKDYITNEEQFKRFFQKYIDINENIPNKIYMLLPVVDIIYKSIEKNPSFITKDIVELFISKNKTTKYGLDLSCHLSKQKPEKVYELEEEICEAYKEMDEADSIIKEVLSNSEESMPKLKNMYVSEKISSR